jgi:sortase (surface protein transpeptidase)
MIHNKKDIENRKIKRNKKRKSRKNKRNKNIKDRKVLIPNIEVKILVIKGIDKDQEVES